MLLCELQGPQQVGADDTVQPGCSILYYQPFSTADLLNWRNYTLPYSEKSQAMIDLLESIFQTHQLTWNDRQQILLTFFNTEANPDRGSLLAPRAGPSKHPRCRSLSKKGSPQDFNTAEGQRVLTQNRTALLHGLWDGAKKPTNMSKTVAIIQKPEESPTDFYERLCEAFRVYTPFNSEAPENQQMVNTMFVAQLYTDIHQKLQTLEGFPGMNATQLLKVANKVFVN
jgi:hypothetical protein